jgi:twitching motility protein PilT
MYSLSQLLALFERVPADELLLTTGDRPHVVHEGRRRAVASQPMSRAILHEVASEILSKDELAFLPSDRPRVVRHEHDGQTFVVELSEVEGSLSLTIRRARHTQEHAKPSTGQPAPDRRAGRHESAKRPANEGSSPSSERMAVTMIPGDASGIDVLLLQMVASAASDLHVCAGTRPALRVHGELRFLDNERSFSSSEVEALVRAVMPAPAAARFDAHRDTDFAYELPGVARFRINVFEDRKGVGIVVRQIQLDVPTVDELGLPKPCVDLCNLTSGLVLVAGPTGAGKTTTLAAMIDHVNRTRRDHIVTIEDPVEFMHGNRKCLVNQREVGHHTKTFTSALRAALREDPDVVLVGEMRDIETISIALETAETGHLVFASLSTLTSVGAIERIIDHFPPDRQTQVRLMLSRSLKGVVAQTLCKKVGGGRVAAHEILLVTPAVASLVREGKTAQIPGIVEVSRALGMVTLNESLSTLVGRQIISPKEALARAVDKLGLLAMLNQVSRISSNYRLRRIANDSSAEGRMPSPPALVAVGQSVR